MWSILVTPATFLKMLISVACSLDFSSPSTPTIHTHMSSLAPPLYTCIFAFQLNPLFSNTFAFIALTVLIPIPILLSNPFFRLHWTLPPDTLPRSHSPHCAHLPLPYTQWSLCQLPSCWFLSNLLPACVPSLLFAVPWCCVAGTSSSLWGMCEGGWRSVRRVWSETGSEAGMPIVTMAIQYLPRCGSQRSTDKLSWRSEVRHMPSAGSTICRQHSLDHINYRRHYFPRVLVSDSTVVTS